MITRNTKLALALVAMASLAACGGGGSSSTGTSGVAVSNPVFTPALPTVGNIVTTFQTALYGVASEEAKAFTLLNAERSQCGFGTLAQNAALDKAALAHANWQIANNTAGHIESAGTPYFTGVNPIDRLTAAGYSSVANDVSEDISGPGGSNTKVNVGTDAIRGLLNAPYHMASLMTGFREVGLSIRAAADIGLVFGGNTMVAELGFKPADGPQVLGASDVKTYPCDGSTSIVPNLRNETPNPVPGRDLAKNPLGSSVYVAVTNANSLSITSSSMINVATGAAVTLRPTLTAANDPNAVDGGGYYFSANQAIITADAPLAPFTKYQVTINGTNNGVSFSRTFSFTTGATT